jgi:fucokinase
MMITSDLVKSALLVTGVINHTVLLESGLKIETSARVPWGSGLGTSSILAAAIVKGLFEIMGEDACNERVLVVFTGQVSIFLFFPFFVL